MYKQLDTTYSQAILERKMIDLVSEEEQKRLGFVTQAKDPQTGKSVPITTVGDYMDYFLNRTTYKAITTNLASVSPSTGTFANILAVLRAHAAYMDHTLNAAPTRFSDDPSGKEILRDIFDTAQKPQNTMSSGIAPYISGHLMILCASMHGKYFKDDPNSPENRHAARCEEAKKVPLNNGPV